jgi:hypothetical protein
MSRVSWMQTFSGQALDPFDPDPKAIRFADIAHGLALTNRFAGQSKAPYSVAQHCVVGSWLIDSKFALPFLMHELGEVYLGDVITQVKRRLGTAIRGEDMTRPTFSGEVWECLEVRHERAILAGLGQNLGGANLPVEFPGDFLEVMHGPEVKAMDLAMLAWEHRDLMGPPPAPWDIGVEPPPEAGFLLLIPWSWDIAELAFTARFWELVKRPAQARLEGVLTLELP